MLERSMKMASRISSLPGIRAFSPPASVTLSEEALMYYRDCQRLAYRAAIEIAQLLQEGWTEARTAKLLETYLRDHGVKVFFHHPFVWFGERTRFDGVRNYTQYQPTRRVLHAGEVYILDVAPILNGITCDIGYTGSLGENLELEKAQRFLGRLRDGIPAMFDGSRTGGEVCNELDEQIRAEGYDNVHSMYPFSVLGHRVHDDQIERGGGMKVLNFGWQSYWSFLSRGLFGQLLNRNYSGSIHGIWAVEPHIGTKTFGAKFEELLLVGENGARWLDETRGEAPRAEGKDK